MKVSLKIGFVFIGFSVLNFTQYRLTNSTVLKGIIIIKKMHSEKSGYLASRKGLLETGLGTSKNSRDISRKSRHPPTLFINSIVLCVPLARTMNFFVYGQQALSTFSHFYCINLFIRVI